MQKSNQSFEYIIIDLPPIGPTVNARGMASAIDAFIFVVEWGNDFPWRRPRDFGEGALDKGQAPWRYFEQSRYEKTQDLRTFRFRRLLSRTLWRIITITTDETNSRKAPQRKWLEFEGGVICLFKLPESPRMPSAFNRILGPWVRVATLTFAC